MNPKPHKDYICFMTSKERNNFKRYRPYTDSVNDDIRWRNYTLALVMGCLGEYLFPANDLMLSFFITSISTHFLLYCWWDFSRYW